MNRLAPVATGLSLAVTVAIAYLVCTLGFVAFPGLSPVILQTLFHGVTFAGPGTGVAGIAWGNYSLVLGLLAAYAFFIGWLFAHVHNRLQNGR